MSTTDPTGSGRLPSSPPKAWEPLRRVARLAGRPLERFFRIEAASGILLLVASAVALGWANSPWAQSYHDLWHTPLGFRIGAFSVERTLEWLVNDGLMVIFFFVAGLEIRREIHHGELSEWRRAALPAVAALGGMLAPAALYLVFAGGFATRSGWGVPIATDIAFAVGILTLLGPRVPHALRVLLLALAVIDDLGAIVVIAIFYSSGIAFYGLIIAALGLAGVLAMQRFGVRTKLAYVVPSIVAWTGIYAAGIHPAIAGVIVGLMTPVRAWLGPDGVRREATSPAESLINRLHPWVAFGIMPVFALANAGVSVSGRELDAASWNVISAVVAGLMVGKPIGILFASSVMTRFGLGASPTSISLRHLVVLGVVAGVGFTMAIFIAQLAFEDAQLLAAAKLGVLAASGGAAVLTLILGRLLLRSVKTDGTIETIEEAKN